MIRKSLFNPIPADSLLDDVHLPISVHLQGYRLVLEPDAVAIDEPTDLKSEYKRKVRTQAGILQLIRALPGLFSRANRMKFHFISLKIGRLLLPYLLLGLLIVSFALPDPWRWRMAVPQIAFWGLAALDSVNPVTGWMKRITSAPRAFGVLMFAALCAVKILFVAPQELWVETRVPTAVPDER